MLITHDPQVAESCDRTIVLQSAVAATAAPGPVAVPARPRFALPTAAVSGVLLLAVSTAFATVKLAGYQPSGQPPARHAAATLPAPAGASAAPTPSPAASTQPPAAPAPGDPGSPDAVVMAFFDAINQRDWPLVWQLGADNLGMSYGQMEHGFSQTAEDYPAITATSGGTVDVLLAAVQTDGRTRIYHSAYLVSNGVIAEAQEMLVATAPRVAPAFAALAGTWRSHDGTMTITPRGLGIANFRVYQNCTSNPAPPCDSFSGSVIYPGGVSIIQLTGGQANMAEGVVEDGTGSGTGGAASLTYQAATDSITVTLPGQGGSYSYCGPAAPAGYCGA